LTALRNAAPLEWAWVSIGALHEGMQVVRNALTACPDAPIEDRARGLNALGIMSFHAGDSHSAITYSYRALSLLGDSVTGERADLRFAALVNRAGGANELGDVHLARDSLDQIESDSRLHTPPDWVIACAMVADGAALLLQGKTTDGYEQLHAASTFAERCGFTWAQGTAELVLARRLLRGGADLPDAVESLRATQRAVRVFNDQGNVFDVLAVLYTSAHALAALSLPGPAVRIRAAVIEQARRIGADPRHYARLAGQDVEQRMLEIEGEYTRAANAGRSMRTPDIIAFFDDVIASHTFDAMSA
jgi:hypothetical protein